MYYDKLKYIAFLFIVGTFDSFIKMVSRDVYLVAVDRKAYFMTIDALLNKQRMTEVTVDMVAHINRNGFKNVFSNICSAWFHFRPSVWLYNFDWAYSGCHHIGPKQDGKQTLIWNHWWSTLICITNMNTIMLTHPQSIEYWWAERRWCKVEKTEDTTNCLAIAIAKDKILLDCMTSKSDRQQ